jgi:hypothetical protein
MAPISEILKAVEVITTTGDYISSFSRADACYVAGRLPGAS